jgi:hypothetical protein
MCNVHIVYRICDLPGGDRQWAVGFFGFAHGYACLMPVCACTAACIYMKKKVPASWDLTARESLRVAQTQTRDQGR